VLQFDAVVRDGIYGERGGWNKVPREHIDHRGYGRSGWNMRC
jgi:hypothetical protein